MDDLIKMVTEKAGINPEQAKNAVHAVFDFVKSKVPMLGDQLKSMVTGGGEEGGGPLKDVMGKIGGMFGK